MPTYDYACHRCGNFSALKRMAARDAPTACPACGSHASRVLIHAPSLAQLTPALRNAHGTNERASHEPKRTTTHGMSCSCCSSVKLPGNNANAHSHASTAPRAAAGRPWMISH